MARDALVPKNRILIEVPSNPENVGVVRVAVAAFAAQLDFAIDEIDDIKVAVSEAVSNAVIHGYAEHPGMVSVEARAYADRLEIVVEDRGRGIEDVEKALQPAFTTDPGRMGLGLTFMDSFMDELSVRSTPGKGATVLMVKRPSLAAKSTA